MNKPDRGATGSKGGAGPRGGRRPLIVRTAGLDVYRNLALEECLLELAPERGPILFFWRSAGAVVIGKNQNPWRECSLAALRAEGCVLARRCSGGGAVYHDAGNLNYALLLPRERYDQAAVFAGLVAALQRVGIPAREGAHHALTAEGRKFSGHAFCYRRGGALHHGTLLVSADLERLQRCLQGGMRLATRAVASHPAPVVNLSALRPGFDLPAAEAALCAAWADVFPPDTERADDAFLETLPWPAWRARQMEWAWQFGHTPAFEVVLPLAAEAGELRCQVEEALITQASLVRGGATPRALAELAGCPFRTPELTERLAALGWALATGWAAGLG